MCKKIKKIVFFLRHNNDIDHITPIIYKLLISTGISIDIIITTDKKLLNDHRIKFLEKTAKTQGQLHLHHITDFFLLREKIIYKTYQLNMKYNIELPMWLQNSVDNLVNSFVTFYNKYFEKVVFCFDWNSEYLTKSICGYGKIYSFTTIALPHGDEPYWNIIQRENDINYAEAIHIYQKQVFFDYIIVPNVLCSRRYTDVLVLGSPRYCKEWVDVYKKIKPEYNHVTKKYKIVLFLRNKHFPVNWEEVTTTIKLITQFKEVFLVVRNHTRGKMTYDILDKNPNFRNKDNLLIDDVTSSSALIEWADLILDIGTSVTWEAIQLNKPVLILEYLQCNTTTFGHYFRNTVIHNRDEMIDTLRKFYKNPERKIWTHSQKQKFIKEIINDSNKKTLEKYKCFLEGMCLNDK